MLGEIISQNKYAGTTRVAVYYS